MGAAFETELARWGPDAPIKTDDVLAEARDYCRRFTRRHSENFSVATFLLPRRLLRHFHAVYAYCRWADDLGDETGGGAQRARPAPLVARANCVVATTASRDIRS